MPIPKPKPSEKRDEFIQRCMSDEKMNEEYTDNSQRFAVCNTQFTKESLVIVNEESFNDYPQSVVNNAKNVLKWVEENGWGSCGTPVGKRRCNDIANKRKLSVDVIKRMYSYLSRHKVDLQSSKSYEDGCGLLMYDAWGGKEALTWSERKLKQLGIIE